ncbi:MAG: hypothetical protein L6427_12360 [Actinomycetia bacterium]|nr:hypothetical protein [Actinomycetes bacterium]
MLCDLLDLPAYVGGGLLRPFVAKVIPELMVTFYQFCGGKEGPFDLGRAPGCTFALRRLPMSA